MGLISRGSKPKRTGSMIVITSDEDTASDSSLGATAANLDPSSRVFRLDRAPTRQTSRIAQKATATSPLQARRRVEEEQEEEDESGGEGVRIGPPKRKRSAANGKKTTRGEGGRRGTENPAMGNMPRSTSSITQADSSSNKTIQRGPSVASQKSRVTTTSSSSQPVAGPSSMTIEQQDAIRRRDSSVRSSSSHLVPSPTSPPKVLPPVKGMLTQRYRRNESTAVLYQPASPPVSKSRMAEKSTGRPKASNVQPLQSKKAREDNWVGAEGPVIEVLSSPEEEEAEVDLSDGLIEGVEHLRTQLTPSGLSSEDQPTRKIPFVDLSHKHRPSAHLYTDLSPESMKTPVSPKHPGRGRALSSSASVQASPELVSSPRRRSLSHIVQPSSSVKPPPPSSSSQPTSRPKPKPRIRKLPAASATDGRQEYTSMADALNSMGRNNDRLVQPDLARPLPPSSMNGLRRPKKGNVPVKKHDDDDFEVGEVVQQSSQKRKRSAHTHKRGPSPSGSESDNPASIRPKARSKRRAPKSRASSPSQARHGGDSVVPPMIEYCTPSLHTSSEMKSPHQQTRPERSPSPAGFTLPPLDARGKPSRRGKQSTRAPASRSSSAARLPQPTSPSLASELPAPASIPSPTSPRLSKTDPIPLNEVTVPEKSAAPKAISPSTEQRHEEDVIKPEERLSDFVMFSEPPYSDAYDSAIIPSPYLLVVMDEESLASDLRDLGENAGVPQNERQTFGFNGCEEISAHEIEEKEHNRGVWCAVDYEGADVRAMRTNVRHEVELAIERLVDSQQRGVKRKPEVAVDESFVLEEWTYPPTPTTTKAYLSAQINTIVTIMPHVDLISGVSDVPATVEEGELDTSYAPPVSSQTVAKPAWPVHSPSLRLREHSAPPIAVLRPSPEDSDQGSNHPTEGLLDYISSNNPHVEVSEFVYAQQHYAETSISTIEGFLDSPPLAHLPQLQQQLEEYAPASRGSTVDIPQIASRGATIDHLMWGSPATNDIIPMIQAPVLHDGQLGDAADHTDHPRSISENSASASSTKEDISSSGSSVQTVNPLDLGVIDEPGSFQPSISQGKRAERQPPIFYKGGRPVPGPSRIRRSPNDDSRSSNGSRFAPSRSATVESLDGALPPSTRHYPHSTSWTAFVDQPNNQSSSPARKEESVSGTDRVQTAAFANGRQPYKHSRIKLMPPKPSSSGPISAPETGTGRRKKTWHGRSPYCHQCRRANSHEKMGCSNCVKVYCSHCITTRYYNQSFDAYDVTFLCPVCRNTCNCTHCARKRGLDYVGGYYRTSIFKGDASEPRQLPWDNKTQKFGAVYQASNVALGTGATLLATPHQRHFIGEPRPEWLIKETPGIELDSICSGTTQFIGTGKALEDPIWRSIPIFDPSERPSISAVVRGGQEHVSETSSLTPVTPSLASTREPSQSGDTTPLDEDHVEIKAHLPQVVAELWSI